jgi:hypothetical protein
VGFDAVGEVYQYWWRICREINVFFFQVRISYVLRFISICDLFTESLKSETDPSEPEKASKQENFEKHLTIVLWLFQGHLIDGLQSANTGICV